VICPNGWDKENLSQPGFQKEYNFIFDGQYSRDSLRSFEPESFIQQIVEKYKNRQLDGVVGVDDYPTSIVATIIAEKLGLPASELKQVQQEIVPEATPQFMIFDPCNFDQNQISMGYPFLPNRLNQYFQFWRNK